MHSLLIGFDSVGKAYFLLLLTASAKKATELNCGCVGIDIRVCFACL